MHRPWKRAATLMILVSGTALVGCSERTPLDPAAQPGLSISRSEAPATLGWQEQARSLVAAGNLSPLAAARVYALLSLAQHGSLGQADDRSAQGLDRGGGQRRLDAERGAIAGASWTVLSFLFPGAQGALDSRLQAEGGAAVSSHFARGVEEGRVMGARMVAWARADRFTVPWTGTIPVGPGLWTGTAPPAGGTFGNVAPYFLTSGSQFRAPPPPVFNSPAYLAALAEIRALSDHRTAQQLALAQFWNFGTGTPTPPGYWNQVAGELVREYGLNEREATHVFGLMNASVMDAFIGCWDSKFHYWYIRPSQADPAITLPIGLPNHPSYPSGHSCASAAAATVLGHLFPAEASQLEEQMEEAGLSRMYAGIHYRFDVDVGQALGSSVASYAIGVDDRVGLLSRIP